ncbi:uncharacterized protein LOC142560409 isoform X1 [Dermacentor variabilis]|uniref:uncharacterized protein LOC142560409 isoform X1 n=1 Tax=Dermacentor variabilis TaxID=34621 RepID=UPI003F5BA4D8
MVTLCDASLTRYVRRGRVFTSFMLCMTSVCFTAMCLPAAAVVAFKPAWILSSSLLWNLSASVFSSIKHALLIMNLRKNHASPHIPPPLAPAPAPVTSGARTRASPEVYPVVPGETRSPAVSYPQPAYYPHPTAPYPQGLPYMGSNMVPLVQPSAAPLTSLSSPFDPPPPYVNQTIPPETHFRTS